MAATDPRTPASAPGPAPSVRRPARTLRSYFWWSLIGALVLIGLYTLLMLWWSYSDGERAGILQKFSRRGWVCKTYEGELAMYVVGGVAPQIWKFSVRDPALAQQLHKAVGQQLRAHYTEHRGLPTNCFGETDYFVDRYEVVAPPAALQAAPRPGEVPATPAPAEPPPPPPAGY